MENPHEIRSSTSSTVFFLSLRVPDLEVAESHPKGQGLTNSADINPSCVTFLCVFHEPEIRGDSDTLFSSQDKASTRA